MNIRQNKKQEIISLMSSYCKNIFEYERRKTREVMVGDIGIGGSNPIRVQSMTISDTMDTAATVQEVIDLVEAGCEIVRITAPSIKEAENLGNIKDALSQCGITVPLVADIHYTPNAALVAAEYVEKVRINPGNYADKKKFEVLEYTDKEYEHELERIEERFSPLVEKCKRLGKAMRIGTNHGSLSDRIMNRYGDTAEGMVESALEFVRICRKYGYHDIVLSMKSSNPLVAIQAYRLLAARMDELNMDYPSHLGVTEAGDGEEGRIKSAVGIGGLLVDGIGDTIRVSLTEDAVKEVPVAFKLVERLNEINSSGNRPSFFLNFPQNGVSVFQPNPFEYNRRETLLSNHAYFKLGSIELPRVELPLQSALYNLDKALTEIAGLLHRKDVLSLNVLNNTNGRNGFVCEVLHVKLTNQSDLEHFTILRKMAYDKQLYIPFAVEVNNENASLEEAVKLSERLIINVDDTIKFTRIANVLAIVKKFGKAIEFKLSFGTPFSGFLEKILGGILEACKTLDYWNVLFSLENSGRVSIVSAYRYLAGRLDAAGANFPIMLRASMSTDFEQDVLDISTDFGSLLCDGIGDSIYIDSTHPADKTLHVAYGILQATRLRISKTEYISCPSCGRTLFNLQTTTERIKSKTDHLKGVKIAIMGCIVNGPGEMADADFGYVGAGSQKVNLFVGKECVARNIPEDDADEKLIALIKSRGMWVDREN